MARPAHKKLILPGDVERSGGRLTIHVPSGYEDEQEAAQAPGALVCHVIVDHDRRLMCGRVYGPDERAAFERHCGNCAREHMDEIKKAGIAHRVPIMDPATWDPEVEAHMNELGKRMLREGRLTVRPNERAGF
jgi:hypothetical protein